MSLGKLENDTLTDSSNIFIAEIKAHLKDKASAESYLKENNARMVGLDHQVDTYFKVAKGRLKLRQGNVESNLIQYNRKELQGIKSSHVNVYPIKDGDLMLKILSESHEILVQVKKERKIFFINEVKFHIDQVKGLGQFIEIEAIGTLDTASQMNLLCEMHMEALGIEQSDLISGSYSDLLIKLS